MSEGKKLQWLDEYCAICGRQINSWDARCSKALGYKNKVCEHCIAKEYDISIEEFREITEHHFGLKPCLGL